MAEDIFYYNKNTLVIKPPKKSPLLHRMIFLGLAVSLAIYICIFCFKQLSIQTRARLSHLQIIPRPCDLLSIDESRIPYLHYPKPITFSRAECGCNPVRLFVIVSMQRSGSGWFETLLNSHVNVSSNGEILSVASRRSNISSILETMDKVYNLDWFTSASKNECSAAVGFKWMLNQGLMAHHEEIKDYFNRRGVSIIFLFRRNLLRQMVSMLANSYDKNAKLLNGTHKSHVHSSEEAKTLSSYKPMINSSTLITDLKKTESMATRALQYFNTTRHIVVFYEDLIVNRTKLVDVEEFLKVPKRNLTSRQVKIHKGPLSEHVKNWGDVNKTLVGTVYEKFLYIDY